MANFRKPKGYRRSQTLKIPRSLVKDNDIFDHTDDLDKSRYSKFSNRDCPRIQRILKEKGKVTWGDVYAPWLINREWYDGKKEEGVSPEEFLLFHTDPSREMTCVQDELDGFAYWIPKINPKYIEKKRCWIPKWTKNIFLIVLGLLPQVVVGQSFKVEDKPIIMPFAIGVNSVNERMGQTEHSPLTEECGYVKIPNTYYVHNGQSLGINVVQIWGGTYLAFEVRCPVCFYEKHDPHPGKIDPDLPFSACDKCGASADNMKAQGASQMFGYKFKGMGPTHMDSYPVRVEERDNDTYLIIYNSFNGVPDTWRELPQNQIILKTYREKFGKEYRGGF